MSKVAVIYWSGTGHTEAMAEAVAKGADGVLLTCAEATAQRWPQGITLPPERYPWSTCRTAAKAISSTPWPPC